jgi:hypothetical protein
MAEGKKSVHQRFLAVMKDVTTIQKEDKKVNNQYRYVSHDAVALEIHKAIVKHGLIIRWRNRWTRDGNKTICHTVPTYINVDDPTDIYRTGPYEGDGIDNSDKGTGKAMSYAKKVALLADFLLEGGEKDNEQGDLGHKPGSATAADTIPVGQNKGRKWSEAPDEFVEWACDADHEGMRAGALAEFTRRENDFKAQGHDRASEGGM